MRTLVLTLLLLLQSASSAAAQPAVKPYSLGIFPYMAARQTVEFFGPVAMDLEAALNHPVKLASVPGFADFRREMADQTYDIALIQPFDYPEMVEKRGYIPLAQLAVPLVTQFYARDDSRYRNLEDLRGTTVAMPPAEAANSRMALRALRDQKLISGRDIQVQYFNSHDSCLQQVWAGTASACATAKPPVTVFEQRMKAKLRAIHDTPPVPHIVFVAHPRVPAAQRAMLQKRIIGWSQNATGRGLLKNLGYPGFVAHTPAEYAVMRNYDPVAGIAGSAHVDTGKSLLLGVFPYLPARALSETIGPMLPRLTAVAGQTVQLASATSYSAFDKNLGEKQYDIVLVQPYGYARAKAAGYRPLAAAPTTVGVFVVRTDSPHRTLADLQGKVVAMPPKESAVAIAARRSLPRDVSLVHHINHVACLNAVLHGEAAACVIGAKVLAMLPEQQRRATRTIAETDRMPGVQFMIHQRVPEHLRRALQDEMLAWPGSKGGRRVLAALGFGDFGPVDTAIYEGLAAHPTRSH